MAIKVYSPEEYEEYKKKELELLSDRASHEHIKNVFYYAFVELEDQVDEMVGTVEDAEHFRRLFTDEQWSCIRKMAILSDLFVEYHEKFDKLPDKEGMKP